MINVIEETVRNNDIVVLSTTNARRYKIVPDESVQYWNLFLFPPPLVLKIVFDSPEFNRSIIFSG